MIRSLCPKSADHLHDLNRDGEHHGVGCRRAEAINRLQSTELHGAWTGGHLSRCFGKIVSCELVPFGFRNRRPFHSLGRRLPRHDLF